MKSKKTRQKIPVKEVPKEDDEQDLVESDEEEDEEGNIVDSDLEGEAVEQEGEQRRDAKTSEDELSLILFCLQAAHSRRMMTNTAYRRTMRSVSSRRPRICSNPTCFRWRCRLLNAPSTILQLSPSCRVGL